jgi:hypothetical protein
MNCRRGVQCSHCHENAFVHLDEKLGHDAGAGTIKRLSTLSAGEISDSCGQCHRTWEEIALTERNRGRLHKLEARESECLLVKR